MLSVLKGFNYPSSEVYCGIHFPWNWGHFHNFAQTCSLVLPLDHKISLTQCRNTCGFFFFFCNLCNLTKGIMRRWLHFKKIFQIYWDVTMNVNCRNCFVLRNISLWGKRMKMYYWEFYTFIGKWDYVLKHNPHASQLTTMIEIPPQNWIMPNHHFCLGMRDLGIVREELDLKTSR